jgi:hypothetical protein
MGLTAFFAARAGGAVGAARYGAVSEVVAKMFGAARGRGLPPIYVSVAGRPKEMVDEDFLISPFALFGSLSRVTTKGNGWE